jgi:hypothetical protein
MDKKIELGPSRPFELPAHFSLWIESENTFAHLHIFRAHLQCAGLNKTVESKAFNPRDPQKAATAWFEFMGLVGNVLVTSIMPPDMLQHFHPVSGGMSLVLPEEGKEEES